MNTLLTTTALLLAFLLPTSAGAADADKPPVASSYDNAAEVELMPFRIIILGTRNSADIELIRKNVAKLAYVKLFVPSVVSQKHLEFEGTSTSDADTLIADVKSLSQDRYDVQAKQDAKRGLLITLRKIQPAEADTE